MAWNPNKNLYPTTTVKPGKPSGEQPGSGSNFGGSKGTKPSPVSGTSPSPIPRRRDNQGNRIANLPGNTWHGIVPPPKPISGSAPASITSRIK